MLRLMKHSDTQTRGMTLLDEGSVRRRDLYLTTHNRQTSMPRAGFEPAIAASERPQTNALGRAAARIGVCNNELTKKMSFRVYICHTVGDLSPHQMPLAH